jgi:hypothetical protein
MANGWILGGLHDNFSPSESSLIPKKERTMAAKSMKGQQGATAPAESEALDALIRAWILDTLGEPEGGYLIQVRHLWDAHFRVNVVVGLDGASPRIAHSYFLVADDDGDIVASTPEISRQYGARRPGGKAGRQAAPATQGLLSER